MPALVDVACLCGSLKETIELKSDLPVKNITCSCNICRYCTGVLYLSTMHVKSRPSFVDRLQVYRSSERVSRYFCSKCGTHVCILGTKDQSWSICSGAVDGAVGLDSPLARLEQYVQHEFVGDTLDGGLIVCLARDDGKAIPLFVQDPDEASVSVSSIGDVVAAMDGATPTSCEVTATLIASCHCGGVKYHIMRPSSQSSACSSPWPDLIVPYHSSNSENAEDVKWWLRASGTKYLAGTCACRSCRLASGVPVQTWAFVPKANIRKIDNTSLDFSLGTLKQYNSSAGCYREFCGTCGATVFWHCDERPELIDVSIGLLRAPEGSRAESWLEWWTERLSFREDALDLHLANSLENGLEALAPPPVDDMAIARDDPCRRVKAWRPKGR